MESLAIIVWKETIERFLARQSIQGRLFAAQQLSTISCVLVYRAIEAKLTDRILEYIVDGFCTSLGAGPDDATISGIPVAS